MQANIRKQLYNVVLSQAISESGGTLCAGNNFGDIFCWNLRKFYNISDRNALEYGNPLGPMIVFSLECREPVNSLKFHDGFLVVGTVGVIYGYVWKEDKQEVGKLDWEVKIPSSQVFETVDINFLLIDQEANHLLAGCGDNLIYEIDLATKSVVRTFEGHKDYIHCLTAAENNLYSASEDGSVIFWDKRKKNQIGSLEPHKNTEVARPKLGKWQGTVSVTNDWLVCGGGPKSSIWHLRSLECMRILPFPEKVHCSELFDDLIFIAGEHKYLHQYSFNGDIVAEVPISGPSAYNVVLQRSPVKFMSVGGASNCLDIYTSFNFRDMVVKLYSREQPK